MLEAEVDKRCNDTGRKNPFRDGRVDRRLDFGNPFVAENEERHCSKGIDTVDGEGDQEREPEISISKGGEAVAGPEITEVLSLKAPS